MPFGIFKLKSPCYVQSFSYSVRNASVDVTSSFQRRRLPPFLDPIFVAATFTPHLTRRGVLLGNRPSSSPDPCPPGTHPQHPMTRPDHLAAEREESCFLLQILLFPPPPFSLLPSLMFY
ncbi:hypothetical protein CDAR_468271 [Caerostris darwini]|uniref:Uncharacterized protein n=1 Tax=Caerostris darwini TaxID=1538125 RepID=A0AAV4WYR4_9ARAC|nr:hypothetical protein CDAR_468271 [Caerostris darwini]